MRQALLTANEHDGGCSGDGDDGDEQEVTANKQEGLAAADVNEAANQLQ